MFQVDMAKAEPEAAISYTFEEFAVPELSQEFTRRLVFGTLAYLAQIDQTIQAVAKEWNIERMANVDRNILRLAVYELRHCPDIPANVAVNEAIELAKSYSGEEAGRFVNGILGVLVTGQNDQGKAPEDGALTPMEDISPVAKTEEADIRPLAKGDQPQ